MADGGLTREALDELAVGLDLARLLYDLGTAKDRRVLKNAIEALERAVAKLEKRIEYTRNQAVKRNLARTPLEGEDELPFS